MSVVTIDWSSAGQIVKVGYKISVSMCSNRGFGSVENGEPGAVHHNRSCGSFF